MLCCLRASQQLLQCLQRQGTGAASTAASLCAAAAAAALALTAARLAASTNQPPPCRTRSWRTTAARAASSRTASAVLQSCGPHAASRCAPSQCGRRGAGGIRSLRLSPPPLSLFQLTRTLLATIHAAAAGCSPLLLQPADNKQQIALFNFEAMHMHDEDSDEQFTVSSPMRARRPASLLPVCAACCERAVCLEAGCRALTSPRRRAALRHLCGWARRPRAVPCAV